MKQLQVKAAKDLKANVAKYEAKVQQLSNQLQLQQEYLAKPPLVNASPEQLPVPSPSKPISVASVEILDKSKCIHDPKKKAFLKKIIGNNAFETYLLYRGSRDGWMAEDFHKRSDRKGPTISLFKIENGGCIGGFTSA